MVGDNRLTLFGIVNSLLLICVAIATVYPVLYIAVISFSDTAYVIRGDVFLFPKGFNLDAYKEVLSNNKIPRAYLNTIYYTALGTTLNVLFTAIAAYPLSQKGFIGRKYWMFAIVLTMFLQPGIIPNYLIVSKLG